jgi:CRISPR-associated protein Cmr6
MSSACRKALLDLKPAPETNAGLLRDRRLRYHKETKPGWKPGDPTPEVELLRDLADLAAAEPYKGAFEDWKKQITDNGWLLLEAVTAGPLAVGLGNASPLEVGLTLHHTYGMPVLPGSAVKGLCRRVAARLLAEKKIEQEPFDALFGKPEAAGCFVFHDAWYDPATVEGKPFHRDVVTVHHQKYYGSRGKDAWPTDFDDPVPVPFLVVRPEARFLFTVQCPSTEWHGFVGEMLKHALEKEGIGGKTNAGYGRFKDFTVPPPPEPAAVEETWADVSVTRAPSPIVFTIQTPLGVVKAAGRRAHEINESLPKELRERLKKKPVFRADVTAEVKGGQVLAIKSIEPKEAM